jgi:hypothetical protein
MEDRSEIVYSLNIEDIQNVAEQELDRELTPKEVKLVAEKVGDYIPWYSAISLAINEKIIRRI